MTIRVPGEGDVKVPVEEEVEGGNDERIVFDSDFWKSRAGRLRIGQIVSN